MTEQVKTEPAPAAPENPPAENPPHDGKKAVTSDAGYLNRIWQRTPPFTE